MLPVWPMVRRFNHSFAVLSSRCWHTLPSLLLPAQIDRLTDRSVRLHAIRTESDPSVNRLFVKSVNPCNRWFIFRSVRPNDSIAIVRNASLYEGLYVGRMVSRGIGKVQWLNQLRLSGGNQVHKLIKKDLQTAEVIL